MIEELQKIVSIHGVSGNEKCVSDYIKGEITPFVDEIYNDNIGNLIAVKKSDNNSKKKLMLCAHMDVNGLIVTYIEDNGYIRVSNLGGVDLYSIIYSTCTFNNGVKGVVVTNEDSYKDLKIKNIYVDIGANNKQEAQKLVNVGDSAFLDTNITTLSNYRVCARGLDNRAGCFALMQAIKNIKNNYYNLYFVFSAQEEVGLRGAKAAASKIMPDIGIAIDVTDSSDMQKPERIDIRLGGGAAIKVLDRSVICSPILNQKLYDLCNQNNIKFQNEILECGGTDTSAMQLCGSGAMVGAISIPTRYIHTGVEEIDLSDLKSCIDVITLAQNSCFE